MSYCLKFLISFFLMHCRCLFSQGWLVFVLHSFRPRDSCGWNWLQNWATALLRGRVSSKEACAPLGAPETDLREKKWLRTCISIHFIMKHCDNWCYHDSQQGLVTPASSQGPPVRWRVSSPGGREARPALHHDWLPLWFLCFGVEWIVPG